MRKKDPPKVFLLLEAFGDFFIILLLSQFEDVIQLNKSLLILAEELNECCTMFFAVIKLEKSEGDKTNARNR